MNNSNADLPITALCIVTEKTKCPSNYFAISKSNDMNLDTDLWKDGLFGKKINRFICYTKDYPINEVFNIFVLFSKIYYNFSNTFRLLMLSKI
jgi:hypothetical protein